MDDINIFNHVLSEEEIAQLEESFGGMGIDETSSNEQSLESQLRFLRLRAEMDKNDVARRVRNVEMEHVDAALQAFPGATEQRIEQMVQLYRAGRRESLSTERSNHDAQVRAEIQQLLGQFPPPVDNIPLEHQPLGQTPRRQRDRQNPNAA